MNNCSKFAALWMTFQTYCKSPQAADPPLPFNSKGQMGAKEKNCVFFGQPLPSPMWPTPVLNHPQYRYVPLQTTSMACEPSKRTSKDMVVKWVVCGITGHPVILIFPSFKYWWTLCANSRLSLPDTKNEKGQKELSAVHTELHASHAEGELCAVLPGFSHTGCSFHFGVSDPHLLLLHYGAQGKNICFVKIEKILQLFFV